MRKLVKTLSLVLSLSLLFGLVACQTKDKAPAEQNGKKLIYTTFYPVYDLTKRIVGDKMNVKMLIKSNEQNLECPSIRSATSRYCSPVRTSRRDRALVE